MIDPSVLVDNLVSALQDIEELVLAMGGDADRIYAFDSTYPVGVNFTKALHEMRSPGIMVRYRMPDNPIVGMKWSHSLSIYLRPQAGDTYESLICALMNGVPASQPLAFAEICINDNVDPIRFRFSEPIQDEAGVEYLEIKIDMDER